MFDQKAIHELVQKYLHDVLDRDEEFRTFKDNIQDNGHLEKIKELLGYGLSVRKISKVLGYSNHIGLNKYLNKRNIKAAV